jgi:regulator of protease activity HflC (stomatin/prohibitin superfamily)
MNANQIENRVRQLYPLLPDDVDDIKACIRALIKKARVDFDEIPTDDNTPMNDRILKSIKAGLDQNNPQMVRAAMDYESEQAGKAYLSQLDVQIVPYRIKDDSLAKIVLEAGDDVIEEVEEALKKRRST